MDLVTDAVTCPAGESTMIFLGARRESKEAHEPDVDMARCWHGVHIPGFVICPPELDVARIRSNFAFYF